VIPPPIMSIAPSPPLKTENNMVWTNTLKKDPRQRMKPKQEESVAVQVEDKIAIKEEE
jgi:hypothetical protein